MNEEKGKAVIKEDEKRVVDGLDGEAPGVGVGVFESEEFLEEERNNKTEPKANGDGEGGIEMKHVHE